MLRQVKSAVLVGLVGAFAAIAAMIANPALAQDKQPIKIGFGIAETGPLGPNGKSALLAMEIWVEETNAKGGLIGRTRTARSLRRPEQPVDGAWHLQQAARCRQSRRHRRRLRHQYAGACDAGGRAAQET